MGLRPKDVPVPIQILQMLIQIPVRRSMFTSVTDPNTLNLDPDPEFWTNLDPDPRLYIGNKF